MVISEGSEVPAGANEGSEEDSLGEAARRDEESDGHGGEAEQEGATRADQFVKKFVSARLGRFKASLSRNKVRRESKERSETKRSREKDGSMRAAGRNLGSSQGTRRSKSTPRPTGDAPRFRGDCTPGWGDDGEWYNQGAWAEFWGEDDGESKDMESAESELSSDRGMARGRKTGQQEGSRAKS